ncbi:MAG: hypothetical protein JWO56_1319, partial [Acidobacteria bacterium]|nr:hypothetical protein [Acidobacteriota bacterium]
MQISLVNVADDNNRGSCALTWAAIDLLRLTFPEAGLTIIPLAAAPAPPAAFRHTARRFPDVRFVAPISAGRQQTDFGRGIRLLHKSVAALRVRADSNGGPDDWLSAIRRSDLVVARGGLSIHAYYNSIRGDLGFVERMSPLLAARRLRRPIVLLGAQIGPFTTVPRFLFRRIASDASAVARDTVSMATLLDFVPASRVLLAPDTVFAMVDEQTDVTQVFTSRGLDPTRPTLALVVTSTLRREESVAQHVALFAPAVRAMRDAGSVAQVIVVVQAAEDRAASWQLAAL